MVVVAVDGSAGRRLVRLQPVWSVHTFDVRVVYGVHEDWVAAHEVALPEIFLRRKNDRREEGVDVLLGVMVRQHLGVVDLGLVDGLQRVLVGVLGLELPKTFSAQQRCCSGASVAQLAGTGLAIDRS